LRLPNDWEGYQIGDQMYPLELLFWGLILAGLIFAWRTGWLRWSATWIGYGLLALAEVLLVMTTSGLHINEPLVVVSGITWLVLVIAILVWTTRRDALDGVMAVLPVMPMWYTALALDGVAGHEAPLFYVDGLLMALIVAWVVRQGEPLRGLAWILVAVAAVALPLSFATVYYSNAILAATPTPGGVITTFVMMLLGFVCFCLPVWLTAIIRWRKQSR
jgi:hypothetical protein